MKKKCPRCNGCMDYETLLVDGVAVATLYCDFCRKRYRIFPGGTIEECNNDGTAKSVSTSKEN